MATRELLVWLVGMGPFYNAIARDVEMIFFRTMSCS